jgi:small subunit ribosomal protein S3
LGQKTHPIGFRLGVIKTWKSRWITRKGFADLLAEDIKVRAYIREQLARAAVSTIEIERAAKKINVNIFTARPGIVIGRKGAEVDRLWSELKHLTGKEINLNIQEIRTPEMDAYLVGEQVARQLEQRVAFRRVMKKAIASTMRMGALGVKIRCSGRLAGAEMGRTEEYHEGRVPLHTLRADIDYAKYLARTTFGTIGIKVWIFKGEIMQRQDQVVEDG